MVLCDQQIVRSAARAKDIDQRVRKGLQFTPRALLAQTDSLKGLAVPLQNSKSTRSTLGSHRRTVPFRLTPLQSSRATPQPAPSAVRPATDPLPGLRRLEKTPSQVTLPHFWVRWTPSGSRNRTDTRHASLVARHSPQHALDSGGNSFLRAINCRAAHQHVGAGFHH